MKILKKKMMKKKIEDINKINEDDKNKNIDKNEEKKEVENNEEIK